jgi:hypothetical protein
MVPDPKPPPRSPADKEFYIEPGGLGTLTQLLERIGDPSRDLCRQGVEILCSPTRKANLWHGPLQATLPSVLAETHGLPGPEVGLRLSERRHDVRSMSEDIVLCFRRIDG